MNNRPSLQKRLNVEIFLQFYYLKDELISFCRQEKLQTTGSKIELTERIEHYLRTGEKIRKKLSKNREQNTTLALTLQTIIEPNFVCTEKHRQFFKLIIGKSFSFNAKFQK